MANKYTNILVPVDGSKITSKIVDKAIEIAKSNSAHIDLLNVVEINQFNSDYGFAIDETTVQKVVEDSKNQLEQIQKNVIDSGVTDVSIHLRLGNPKPVIAQEFPKEKHNDLIVMGSNGLNMIAKMITGSVTKYTISHAVTDILIVKNA